MEDLPLPTLLTLACLRSNTRPPEYGEGRRAGRTAKRLPNLGTLYTQPMFVEPDVSTMGGNIFPQREGSAELSTIAVATQV